MACRIFRDNKGNITRVNAPNGNESELYNSLKDHVKNNKSAMLYKDPFIKGALANGLIKDMSDEEVAFALYAKTHTEEFINWFGDWINDPENSSKAVDKNGEPLILFHGTTSPIKFDKFNTDVVYTTTDYNYALNNFGFKEENNVFPLYMSIKNPLKADKDIMDAPEEYSANYTSPKQIKKWLSEKVDGVVGKDSYAQVAEISRGDVWVAFTPEQVKSLFNEGAFSNDANIYKQLNSKSPEIFVKNLLSKYRKKGSFGKDNIIDPQRYNEVLAMVAKFNREHGRTVILYTSPDGNNRVRVDNTNTSVRQTGIHAANVILDKLSKKFGIPYEFDETLDAKGAYINGVVYINPKNFTDDTLFHEFAHPFIAAIKTENKELYNNLKKELQKEGKILERTRNKYTPFFKSKGLKDQALEDAIYEEAIVQALGEESANLEKTLRNRLQEFWNWLSDMLKEILGKDVIKVSDLNSDLTFKDLAVIMNSTTQVEINPVAEDYYQLNSRDLTFYVRQLNNDNLSKRQKDTAEKLLRKQANIKLDETTHTYTYKDQTNFKSVTKVLDEDPYYSFKGDSEEFAINREWGNQIDKILQGVILGQTLEEIKNNIDTDIISDEAIQASYDSFLGLKAANPDSIILTQMIFYNTEKQVAGSADVVLVDPDGQIRIPDLKSSQYTTKGDYQSKSGFTNNYKKRFKSNGETFASKSDRHEAQLSIYAYMARAMGMNVKEVGVLPVKLDTSGNVVTNATAELYIPHIMNTKFREFEKDADHDLKESVHQKIVNKIRLVLGQKIAEDQKAGKNTFYLEDLARIVELDENLSSFIDSAHRTFMGSENWDGYYNRYKKILEKAADDPMQFLQDINEIENEVNIYNSDNVLKELKALLQRERRELGLDITPDPGSPLAKLTELLDILDIMSQDFNDKVPDAIATILAKQVDDALIEKIEKNLAHEQAKLAKYRAQGKSEKDHVVRKLIKEIDQEKERFQVDEQGKVNIKETIKREITKGGYKDIGGIDRWFTPAVSIDNSFLPTFALTIKEAFERVRRKAINSVREYRDAFEKYQKVNKASVDRPEEFNKGLYKTRRINTYQKDEEGNYIYKNVLALVAPYDYDAFYSSQEAMYKRYNEMKETDLKAANEFKTRWFAENTVDRPMKDVKVNGVTVIEGIETLKKNARKIMNERAYEAWVSSNQVRNDDGTYTYSREFSIPSSKFKDSEFESLSGAKLDYYTFLLNRYFTSQSKLPKRKKESDKFILPYIKKNFHDRVMENGAWDATKHSAKDAFKLMDDDYNEVNYADDVKTVPILYFGRAVDANEVTKDLAFSIMKFEVASDRWEEQNNHAVLADNLLAYVQNTSPAITNSSGYKVLSQAAKKVGLKGLDGYAKKHGGNNIAAMLEAFIDTQIYGRTKIKQHMGNVELGKVADTIIGFASKTQIALNPITSVANALQANAMNFIEAAAREFYSKRQWGKALLTYEKHELDFLKDSMSPYAKSLIGQLIELYEPLQGEYLDNFGRRMTKSLAKDKMNWSTAFAMQHKGEHHAMVTSMIAMMQNTKVMQNGKEIALMDAYELGKDGRIKLKDGVEMNDLVDTKTQRRMHAVNKRLHGVYNSFDAGDAQRHWWGRLLIMYRKFLIPGWKKRWKAEGVDYELGDITEGTYLTFYKKLFGEARELAKAIFGKESTLSEWEVHNAKRALAEHLLIMVTGAMVMLLARALEGADDDDKRKYATILYFAMRLNSELSIYGAPGDPNTTFLPNINEIISIYKTPTFALNVFEKATKLVTMTLHDVGAIAIGEEPFRYEKDSGIFEKGDSKTIAQLIKLLGINSKAMIGDPEEAIKSLQLIKGTNR